MESTDSRQNIDEYLIDVAAEKVYVSQDKAYHDAFTKWRNDKHNRFGYRFVHDSREHTYVDGEGYADSRSSNAERSSLRQCFSFLGMSMLTLFLFNQLQFMVMRMLFSEKTIEWVYYSDNDIHQAVSFNEMAVSCGFRIFSMLVIILMYVFFIHLPVRVSFPLAKLKPKFFIYSLTASLIMAVVFHVLDKAINSLSMSVGLDVTLYTLKLTDSNECFVLYLVCEMFIIPVMHELLFRGCVLQLFRQFGDRFAILVSSFAAACCYHDITKFVYVFSWSVLLGIITIKSGSILPAEIIKVISNSFAIILNTILTSEKQVYALLLESVICLSVLLVCVTILLIMRIKLIRPFKINPDYTALPVTQKIRESINSPWSVVWLSVTLFTIILSFELK